MKNIIIVGQTGYQSANIQQDFHGCKVNIIFLHYNGKQTG